MKNQSIGIAIFGVLFILLGFFQLLLLVTSGFWLGLHDPASRSILMVLGAIQLLSVMAGIGLLTVKRWAWLLTLILAFTNAGFSTMLFIASRTLGRAEVGRLSLGSLLVGLGWSGLIVWYFLRPSVKAQFISKTTNR